MFRVQPVIFLRQINRLEQPWKGNIQFRIVKRGVLVPLKKTSRKGACLREAIEQQGLAPVIPEERNVFAAGVCSNTRM